MLYTVTLSYTNTYLRLDRNLITFVCKHQASPLNHLLYTVYASKGETAKHFSLRVLPTARKTMSFSTNCVY